MNKNEKENLEYWLKIAKQPESLSVETSGLWEKWVARPVVEHVLAPREARAILEVFGTAADYGLDIAELLIVFTDRYILPPGIRGAQAGASLRKRLNGLKKEEKI